jgi:hypothetical protein
MDHLQTIRMDLGLDPDPGLVLGLAGQVVPRLGDRAAMAQVVLRLADLRRVDPRLADLRRVVPRRVDLRRADRAVTRRVDPAARVDPVDPAARVDPVDPRPVGPADLAGPAVRGRTDRVDLAGRVDLADQVDLAGPVGRVDLEAPVTGRVDQVGLGRVDRVGPVGRVDLEALATRRVDQVGLDPADLVGPVARVDPRRRRTRRGARSIGVARNGVAPPMRRTASAHPTMVRRLRRRSTDSAGMVDLRPEGLRPAGTGRRLRVAGTVRRLPAVGTRDGMGRRAT